MSEETTTDQVVEKTVEPSTEVKPEQNMIPQSRFNEIIAAKKELETKLAEFKSKQEENRQKELEKQGEYKTLLDETKSELENVSKQAEQWQNYQATRRKTLIEKLPEQDRELYDDLKLEKLELIVERHLANKGVLSVDNSTSNPEGEFGGYGSMAEWATNDPDGYKKANRKKSKIRIGYGA